MTSLTATQINEAFAALGQAPPSSALLASLESLDQYVALNTIIALPQVVSQDIPIVSMFDLALGHDPTGPTLASMVATLNATSMANIAVQFVSSQSFANVYNGGHLLNPDSVITSANDSIITALFVNGLGHTPTPTTLNGFHGLTLAQAFLAFTTSNTVAVSGQINASMLGILELATGVPAQAPPIVTQSFQLTLAQDEVVSGSNTINTTTPGVAVQSTGNVTVVAPLETGTIFGTTAAFPTLTSGDVINLAGPSNALQLTLAEDFFGGTNTITNLTIAGVQSWDVSNVSPVPQLTELFGANITSPTTLTYHDSLGSLQIGANAEPVGLSSNGTLLQTINATNDGFHFGYQYLAVSLNAADFTGHDTLTVNADGVGHGAPTHGEQATNFGIIAGPTTGTTGYATWVVNSSGGSSVNNNIALGAEQATNATTLTIADDGASTYLRASFTDGSGPGNWENLVTINAAGTSGQLTVTGDESFGGLLSDNATALTNVFGGTGADVFDLTDSSWTNAQVAGVTISGGFNTTGTNSLADSNESAAYVAASGAGLGTVVELFTDEINQISGVSADAFGSWSGVQTLYDVGFSNTGVDSIQGTINMADFPGTNIVTLANGHSGNFVHQGGDLSVTNAQDGFIFNFQDADQQGHNFQVTGASSNGAGDTVTVNYGTGYNYTADSHGTFTSLNFDNTDINVWSGFQNGGDGDFYSGGILAVSTSGGAETVNLESAVDLTIGTTGAGDVPGFASLNLFGGTIFNLTSGTLNLSGLVGDNPNFSIGVTDANVINDTSTGSLDMLAPDNAITLHDLVLSPPMGLVPGDQVYTGISVTADGESSLLQGSLGVEDLLGTGGKGATDFTAITGNDSLDDQAGGNTFYGAGGSDSITIGGGSNTIHFGEISVDGNIENQVITNMAPALPPPAPPPPPGSDLAYQGFWGVPNGTGPDQIGGPTWLALSSVTSDAANTAGTSADATDLTGFSVASYNSDVLDFNVNAWADNKGPSGTLIEGDGKGITLGPADMQLVTTPGTDLNAGTNVILDGIDGGFANATELAASLASSNGDVIFDFAFGGKGAPSEGHMLVAYDNSVTHTLSIADVDFVDAPAVVVPPTTPSDTLNVYASDMVTGIVGTLNELAIHNGAISFSSHA
jgi:hypothetical protein